MAITIATTGDTTYGRMRIQVQGGTAGTLFYLLRRDRNGTAIVRETSGSTMLWPASGWLAIYDYEARQGLETDYIITDGDGLALLTERVTIPNWGTWLKHPGKPFLNTRCLWNEDSEYTRAPRRVLLQPRGAKYPVALYDTRKAPAGEVKLATTTEEDARMLTALIADGGVVMIDVNPTFGVPVRYVSIGEVKGARMSTLTKRGLTVQARIWTIQVDEVATPLGLPAGQSFTYAGIPAIYGSYIAIAATVPTYEDLAVGYGS